MGPIALFDKSFLESLNPDEAVWFDHFFLANVCPMFYMESQSDLAKDGSNRGTPEELVRKLANKFPDFSGLPNVHHIRICSENLLGAHVPMCGQVIRPPACHATVDGHSMALLPESREAKVFLRWTQGEYEDEERRAAAEWRAASVGHPTADVIAMLKAMGVLVNQPCTTLADVRAMTDDVISRLPPNLQLCFGCALLGIPPATVAQALLRFEKAGRPPLAALAPYADFCLRVELFFHLAVDSSRMDACHRMDMCYLFYLPFCQLFVSMDNKSHKPAAPLFLRPDQEFIAGNDLKAALRKLNDHYSALPESERQKSIHHLAPFPPRGGNNLVTRLWDRHLPNWRQPRTVKATQEELKTITAAWKKRIEELELVERARAGDETHVPVEELDVLIQRRVSRKRKGSWWLVPEELRASEAVEDDQVLEFHNGATPEIVVDQRVSVYIRSDGPEIASLRWPAPRFLIHVV